MRVVAPHLRGYAPSGLAADGSYHVGALMADAVALHGELGGDDRAVLVGHDWGAITANALGGHPDSPYGRVVTLAVPPLSALAGASPRLIPRQLRMSWYTLFNQLPLLPERTVDRGCRGCGGTGRRATTPPRTSRWSAPPGRPAPTSPPRWATTGRSGRRGRCPRRTRRWQRTLDAVPTVPLLYLHGADDGCLQVGYVEHAAARLPATARVRDRARTPVTSSRSSGPTVVNELVAEFLSRWLRRWRWPTVVR